MGCGASAPAAAAAADPEPPDAVPLAAESPGEGVPLPPTPASPASQALPASPVRAGEPETSASTPSAAPATPPPIPGTPPAADEEAVDPVLANARRLLAEVNALDGPAASPSEPEPEPAPAAPVPMPEPEPAPGRQPAPAPEPEPVTEPKSTADRLRELGLIEPEPAPAPEPEPEPEPVGDPNMQHAIWRWDAPTAAEALAETGMAGGAAATGMNLLLGRNPPQVDAALARVSFEFMTDQAAAAGRGERAWAPPVSMDDAAFPYRWWCPHLWDADTTAAALHSKDPQIWPEGRLTLPPYEIPAGLTGKQLLLQQDLFGEEHRGRLNSMLGATSLMFMQDHAENLPKPVPAPEPEPEPE
jgi:hypothetical protein